MQELDPFSFNFKNHLHFYNANVKTYKLNKQKKLPFYPKKLFVHSILRMDPNVKLLCKIAESYICTLNEFFIGEKDKITFVTFFKGLKKCHSYRIFLEFDLYSLTQPLRTQYTYYCAHCHWDLKKAVWILAKSCFWEKDIIF